jgi:hypothetical protein
MQQPPELNQPKGLEVHCLGMTLLKAKAVQRLMASL